MVGVWFFIFRLIGHRHGHFEFLLAQLVNAKIEELKTTLTAAIANESSGQKDRIRYLTLWIWITKALVLREHSSSNFFAQKVRYFLIN